MNRIVGLETEYGCLTNTPAGSFIAVERVRDWISAAKNTASLTSITGIGTNARQRRLSLQRRPRLYDMGHLEYCTPECVSLLDILRYDRAGDALALQAVKALGLAGDVSFIRNNMTIIPERLSVATKIISCAVPRRSRKPTSSRCSLFSPCGFCSPARAVSAPRSPPNGAVKPADPAPMAASR